MFRPLIALVLAALVLGPVHAQEGAAEAAMEAADAFGLAVGETVPGFTVMDATGAARTLSDLAGPEGAVIYFNRSLEWCPICLRQTLEVEAALEAFEDAGWGVAVLTYDSVSTLARVADQRQLAVTLLADEGSPMIDAFGIRAPISADPDHMAHGVPYPLAFAIRPDGTVAAKFWHEAGFGQQRGYATRISTDDVIAVLTAS
jgi:peroxiredoxin